MKKNGKGRNFNGEGTFYYSESLKRWVGQFTNPNTGKRQTVSDVDEKKARVKLRKAMSDAENGKYTEKSTITIENLAQEILDLKLNSNIICEATYYRDLDSLAIIKNYIGNIRIQKVTRSQIQDFLNTIKEDYSNSVIGKVYQLLKTVMKEAILRENITKNPMNHVIKPKSVKKDKKIRALTIEEHQKFLNALNSSYANHKYKNVFLIAINTGMRSGEILALQPKDIDFKDKIIHVRSTLSKNKKGLIIFKYDKTKTYAGTRDLPIDDFVVSVLKESIKNMCLNQYGVIFSSNNKLISHTSINGAFLTICRNLEFEIKKNNEYLTEHSLRHTFATRCIEAGMPAHVLQKLLGHTDISTTINTYTDIFNKYKEDEIKKVIEYKKMHNI